MMKTIQFLALISLFVLSCSPRGNIALPQGDVNPTPKTPQNVVLIIGDGMGLGQITSSMYQNNNSTNLEQFTTVGLQKTHSHSDLITDSAASGTALACGVKTYNYAIGVDQDTTRVMNMIELSEAKGFQTGIIATSTIVHATPASFFAHATSRRNYEKIATFLPGSGIDYFCGGGKKYFYNRNSDTKNILRELENENYVLRDSIAPQLRVHAFPLTKKYGRFTSEDSPSSTVDGREYLIPETLKALEFLHSRASNGFFLMVESSQIDWAGHGNDNEYLMSEMDEFDRLVGEVLDFVKKDGNTLLIVTADHECGGVTLINNDDKFGNVTPHFSSTYHTSVMVPVFAFGPGSEKFSGIYENTEIFHKIVDALDLLDQ